MKRRRLRRATLCGREMTVRGIKKIMLVEKIITNILITAFCVGFGYLCITELDRDVTMMLVIVPLSVYLFFDKRYRFPLYMLACECKDELLYGDADYWETDSQYPEYEKYYDYHGTLADDCDDCY